MGMLLHIIVFIKLNKLIIFFAETSYACFLVV